MAKYQGNSLPFLIKNIIKLKRKKLYWDLPVERQNFKVKQKKKQKKNLSILIMTFSQHPGECNAYEN